MRIGILTHNFPATSQERKDAGIFLYDFAQELAKSHKVFVLCPSFEGKKEKYTKVPVTYFPWKGGKNKLGDFKPTSPSSLIQFVSLLKNGRRASEAFVTNNKLDYIIAAWAFPSGDFAYYAHKKTGVPYAVWTLGSDMNKFIHYPFLKQLIIRSLKAANLRIANSHALIKKVELVSHRPCQFLPAVTNLSEGVVNVERDKNVFTFLYVGRLESVKGPDILLEACEKLPLGNWKIEIGGDGTLEKSLHKTKTHSKHNERIDFLGRLDGKLVADQMKKADCLVVPSRNESLPLVIIEAARNGLPVIATDVGDCKHIIKQYNVGYVARPNDANSLYTKMKKALQTKGFRKRFGKGTNALARDFTQEKVIAHFNNYVKGKN